MPITKYEGKTFENQVFKLEECWFVNCVLRRCVIFLLRRALRVAECDFRQLPVEVPRACEPDISIVDTDWCVKTRAGPATTNPNERFGVSLNLLWFLASAAV